MGIKHLLESTSRQISIKSQILEISEIESFTNSKKAYIINFGHDFTKDTAILLKVIWWDKKLSKKCYSSVKRSYLFKIASKIDDIGFSRISKRFTI